MLTWILAHWLCILCATVLTMIIAALAMMCAGINFGLQLGNCARGDDDINTGPDIGMEFAEDGGEE